MKLIAADAEIIEVKRSKLGLYNIITKIDGAMYEFSVITLNNEPVIISSSIIDALIENKIELAHQLSALFNSVYSLHKTDIEERVREA